MGQPAQRGDPTPFYTVKTRLSASYITVHQVISQVFETYNPKKVNISKNKDTPPKLYVDQSSLDALVSHGQIFTVYNDQDAEIAKITLRPVKVLHEAEWVVVDEQENLLPRRLDANGKPVGEENLVIV